MKYNGRTYLPTSFEDAERKSKEESWERVWHLIFTDVTGLLVETSASVLQKTFRKATFCGYYVMQLGDNQDSQKNYHQDKVGKC